MQVVKIVNKSQNPLPKYQTPGANAFDLSADEEKVILEGETQIIDTGLIFDLSPGYALRVVSRSGLAVKGIVVANSPGLVDSDYRGTVKVILKNINNTLSGPKNHFKVNVGDRIAQAYVEYLPQYQLEEIFPEDLSKTERGENGLGSTKI